MYTYCVCQLGYVMFDRAEQVHRVTVLTAIIACHIASKLFFTTLPITIYHHQLTINRADVYCETSRDYAL